MGASLAPWALNLLGAFELRPPDGGAMPPLGRKAMALFAFLAIQPRRRSPRDRLATLFWGDVPEAQARTNLRQALAQIRRALGDSATLIEASGDAAALSEDGIVIDIDAFEACIGHGSTAALEQAANLYRGNVLEGFSVQAPSFEEWLAIERERLREAALGAFGTLLDRALQEGRPELGIRTALRALSLDPFQERAHRALMRLYARQGRHAAALKQYEALRSLLEQELQVLPEPETERLMREIREARRRMAAVPETLRVPAMAIGDEAPVLEAPAEERAPGESPAAGAAMLERRHVTMLACGFADAGDLLGALDPEAFHELLSRSGAAVGAIVAALGGVVVRSSPDGLLACFGYPRAHEDDAERAVRAALRIAAEVSAESPAGPVAMQAGVASGIVVIGREGPQAGEPIVVGEAPAIAARLRDLAPPGGVVLAGETRRLNGALFVCEAVEGGNGPAGAGRVVGEGDVAGRFEALRGAPAMRDLVGREEELGLLLRRWRQAAAGEGRVVLVSGEPGIGKSRLAIAVEQHLADESHLVVRLHCSPRHSDSALHPVVDPIERAAGILRGDDAATRRRKLEAMLDRRLVAREDSALFVELLGLRGADEPALPDLAPRRRRERMLATLVRFLETAAGEQPVLLVIEDLHWTDPTTHELVDMLVHAAATTRVLVIVTFRTEFAVPWTGLPQVTTLALGRLGQRDRLAMVEALAGERGLPPEVAAQIVERADGVPLFVEELTKAVLESGALDGAVGPSVPLAIPTTLHASLLSRLDRSAAVLQVAQAAAALGREFSYRLIRAVSAQPDAVLDAALANLERAELVFRRGRPPEARYSFKHALIQDAAYGTMMRAGRRALHARIAEVLSSEPPDGETVDPQILAHHYAEADLFAQAVAEHRRAGALLLQRSGTTEALQQVLKARDLMALIEQGPARTDLEIDLQLALGAAFRGARGTAAPETGEAYARARQLCEAAGDRRRTVLALHGLGLVYFNRSQLDEAFEAATAMLKLGGDMADAAAGRAGHQALGLVHFASGRFQQARFHLSAPYEVMSQAPEDLAQPAADLTGLIYLAWTCFALGYPEEAIRHGTRALDLARPGAQRFRYAVILCNACCIDQFAGRPDEARVMAEALIAIARERGYVIYGGVAFFVRGWARTRRGEVEAGLAEMREGIAAYRSDGRALDVPYCLVVLAEALVAAGRACEARAPIAEALEMIERNGERWFEAEARRVAGDIALTDDRAEAERCYEAALEVARDQGARMWELRAAAALARLRRDAGRPAEARALLAPVVAWFTEGFALPDLTAARALLGELA